MVDVSRFEPPVAAKSIFLVLSHHLLQCRREKAQHNRAHTRKERKAGWGWDCENGKTTSKPVTVPEPVVLTRAGPEPNTREETGQTEWLGSQGWKEV